MSEEYDFSLARGTGRVRMALAPDQCLWLAPASPAATILPSHAPRTSMIDTHEPSPVELEDSPSCDCGVVPRILTVMMRAPETSGEVMP
jgi:hypothetical protein